MNEIIAQLLLGESPAMRDLRALLARLAQRTIPVCIQGETGVGKELVAQALHDASGRRGAFVPFNVCAVPDSLFESSVFGHVRGAFSGATGDSEGFLSQAHSGTVFMDEIGSLPAASQAKLLRAVELGVFRPVGGRRDQRSDFRVVVATNDDIPDLVARGSFRADLAYRLTGFVKVPPLRERVDDISVLATLFLQRNSARFGGPLALTHGALRALQDYSWPGNVRQLKSVLECAAVMTTGTVLGIPETRDALGRQYGAHREEGVHPVCADTLVERGRMLTALEAVKWDTSLLAVERSVSRATIYRLMSRLKITPNARRLGVSGER